LTVLAEKMGEQDVLLAPPIVLLGSSCSSSPSPGPALWAASMARTSRNYGL